MKCEHCGYDDKGTGDFAHVCEPFRAEPYTDPSPADSKPGRAAYREPWIAGAVYICSVPVGAQLLAVDGKVIVVAPTMEPCFVTPTGLKPIPVACPSGL